MEIASIKRIFDRGC